MLVDQAVTPLFLGAIHRTLMGTTLEELGRACPSTAAFAPVAAAAAYGALSQDTLVATDGERWATITLALPPDRAAVEMLHDDLLPSLGLGDRSLGYHHSVDEALTRVRSAPRGRRADAGPGVRPGRPRRPGRTPAPREGHVVPAEAQHRRAHPVAARRVALARRTIRPERHLDLHAGSLTIAAREEALAQSAGHLHDVVRRPARHRGADPTSPDRAVEGVDSSDGSGRPRVWGPRAGTSTSRRRSAAPVAPGRATTAPPVVPR